MEPGIPATREQIVDDFVSACIEAGLFGHRTAVVPAKSRWLTCAECLTLISFGMLAHRLLPRVWILTFPQYEVPRNPGDVDDYHRLMRAKNWRAKVWLEHPDSCMRSLAISVASSPADHLLMVLQRVDEEGGSIFRVTDPERSPLVETLQAFARFVLSPRESPLGVLLHHFEERSLDSAVVCMQILVRCVLGFSARIWRLHCKWTWFPYMLARLVAPGVSDFEKAIVSKLLFDTSECCLDAGFSLKVRRLALTAAALLTHQGLLAAIRLWCQKARITNMHMERLIGLQQRASPSRCAIARALGGLFETSVGFACKGGWQQSRHYESTRLDRGRRTDSCSWIEFGAEEVSQGESSSCLAGPRGC